MATSDTSGTGSPVTVRRMLPVLAASTVGTAIEWYDFFLYGFLAATVFPKIFFPTLSPINGILAAFTTYFVGFLARPIGGAFFGWFGDRVGRKSTLIATLLLMGIATALVGLLPGYAQIGLVAPILLTLLRFLQGAGVGGEWGGSVLLSQEYGDDRRRGFWASWPQTGVPVGLALAALALLGFRALFPGAAFLSIGWRIPLLLSILLIFVGLYIRLRILETPSFTKVKQEGRIVRDPLMAVIRHHWREIILSALLRSGEQAPFYIFTTFILAYGVNALKVPLNLLYTGLIVILLQTKIPVVVIIAIVLSVSVCHDWLYGPQAALIAERFGTRLRYSGASLGYQLASITAGGPAPIIATLLVANSKGLIGPGVPTYTLVAVYIIFMAAVSFVATTLLKEYAGRAAAEDVLEPVAAASGE